MSVRGFSSRIYRLIQLTLGGIRLPFLRRLPVRLPVRVRPPAALGQIFPSRIPQQLGKQSRAASKLRFWRSLFARNRIVFTRLGSAGVFDHRHYHFRHPNYLCPKLGYLVGTSERYLRSAALVEAIRKAHNKHMERPPEEYPLYLDGYDINDLISKGCNGAVFSAKVSEQPEVQLTRHCNFGLQSERSFSPEEDRTAGSFPLAIKVCFNYTAPNMATLIADMWPELVPCTALSNLGPVANCGTNLSRRHANVVQIHAAFIDRMRLLPRMQDVCPAALPHASHPSGAGQPETLFIVMPRYTMTLREYLLMVPDAPVKCKQLLLAQLLEAVRFLREQRVSHRDLKSNNILLEFDDSETFPVLILCDFGCCLADDGFIVPYFDESTDLGGNLALRPPEITTAEPGFFHFVDFSKADLWAAGTIGYEMFLGFNPFYGRMRSATYDDKTDLPVLSDPVPHVIRRLLQQILRRHPKSRPTPSCAATVSALSLFSKPETVADVADEARAKIARSQTSLTGNLDFADVYGNLSSALMLYAAETAVGFGNRLISRAEHLVRMALLRRIDSSEFLEAAFYFHAGDQDRLTQSTESPDSIYYSARSEFSSPDDMQAVGVSA